MVPYRLLYGQCQIGEKDPSIGKTQYADEDEAETGRVPGMATIEIAQINPRSRIRSYPFEG